MKRRYGHDISGPGPQEAAEHPIAPPHKETQLDRIERKLDQVLNPRSGPNITQVVTDADRERSRSKFLRNAPTEKPKWGRWKTAAVVIAYILGLAVVATVSWSLWGIFIRMHS